MCCTFARVLSAVALGGLLSSPAAAAPIAVDYVDSGGREWASLVETVSVSWNQLAAACPQDGVTECTSDTGALETTGWIWATRDQVRDLFYDLGVPSGGLDDYFHIQVGSSFGPRAMSVFGPNMTNYLQDQTAGWTATLGSANGAFTGVVTRAIEPGIPDFAGLVSQQVPSVESPLIGAWLFRDEPAPSVPEPLSMLLLGTGLAGLARRIARS